MKCKEKHHFVQVIKEDGRPMFKRLNRRDFAVVFCVKCRERENVEV